MDRQDWKEFGLVLVEADCVAALEDVQILVGGGSQRRIRSLVVCHDLVLCPSLSLDVSPLGAVAHWVVPDELALQLRPALTLQARDLELLAAQVLACSVLMS